MPGVFYLKICHCERGVVITGRKVHTVYSLLAAGGPVTFP